MISNTFSCRMIFFLLAFYVGNWTIRIPDIKAQVNASYTGMGLNGAAFAAGAVIMMVFSSRVIRILTSRKAILHASWFIAAGFIGLPFAGNLPLLLALSFGTGLAIGLTEVAMNAQASDLETIHGKSMMSGFHAFFSLGLLAGSLCTSIAVELNIGLTENFVVVALVLCPVTIFFSIHLVEDLNKGARLPAPSIFFRWPVLIVLLVFIAMTSSLVEGAINSWAALYMQDIVAASGFQLGLGVIIFNVFMVGGRLTGDRVREIVGVRWFLLGHIVLSMVACFTLFRYSTMSSSILGFSLAGLGVSNLVPVAYSLAGKNPQIETSVAVSIISICSFGAFMMAPTLEGVIADFFGLEAIFIPLLILLLAALFLVRFFSGKSFEKIRSE